MFDILSKFDGASNGIVNESATATRSRSSSAGDPAMHDILSKFYGAVSEAGVDTSVPAGDKNKAFDKLSDTDFDQTTGDPDVMATPSYNGYQATKNMKTGDTTSTYDNNGLRISQSRNAQGDITRQAAQYKMGDTKMSMAQAGDEKFADAEQIATGLGPGAYGSAYDAGDGDLQYTSIGQVGSMDQTATSVSSDASGNTNAYMSDRDTSNMIKQQEKDIARLQTDKLFNDVNGEGPDTVAMGVPLLIRMMEFAREEAQSDEDLHVVVKKMLDMGGDLSMDDYDTIMSSLNGEVDQPEVSMEDVVSKDKAKRSDVVGKKTAVDDIVQELSKSFSDFIAQVEEEKDDMSFFKKG